MNASQQSSGSSAVVAVPFSKEAGALALAFAKLSAQLTSGWSHDLNINLQSLSLEVAEALVDEDGVELDASVLGLYDVRESQGQGERGLEALTA